MKVCFLILHYNEIELTQRAVESIMRMDVPESDRPIVIVDNCSPNGSGQELIKKYCPDGKSDAILESLDDSCSELESKYEEVNGDNVCLGSHGIRIILNNENGGFAKGNNIGYRYIREHLDADFVVALNNDISFPQTDFIGKLTELYESEPEDKRFYLAGPDVWTPNIRSHISPLDKKYKGKRDVEKRFDQISQSIKTYSKPFDLATYTRYLQDKYAGTWLLNMYNRIRSSEYDGALPHGEPAYNCVLNGACLIFDRRYIEEYNLLFDEATFLYAEEDFLTYRLVKAEKPIRYCPELTVDHIGQGSSNFSSLTYRSYCDKMIQTEGRIRESFEKYLEYIDEEE